MISGPIPPHPRLVVEGLLRFHRSRKQGEAAPPAEDPGLPVPSGADFLEEGLELFEQDLVLEEGLAIDFFGKDAGGAPVAVLASEEEEQDELPLRLLDLDAWFRRGRTLPRGLLAQACPALAKVELGHGLRFVLVAHSYESRFLERLQGLDALDLTVLEFGRLRVRGEGLWFLRALPPWDGDRDGRRPLPEGLADEDMRGLVARLMDRVHEIDPRPVIQGDRYHREIWLRGGVHFRVEVDGASVEIRIPEKGQHWILGDEGDIDRILDALLRVELEREALGVPSRDGDAEWESPRRKNGSLSTRSEDSGSGGTLGGRVHLSEEEMAAFFPD